MKKDLTNSSVNIFLEIDDVIHLVAMEKDKLETISNLIKMCAVKAYKTSKTQKQLNDFLGI